MLIHRTSVVVILAFCILAEASGLGIHLFSKKDGSVKDDSSSDEGTQKEETPRPPLLTIPRPEDHPLHHNNDPNHPFNNLPSLPNMGGTRSTIVATKTVYVEVTSTITQHPICIEVHGVKPPCLPHYNHGHGYESGYGIHSEHGISGIPSHNYGYGAGNGYFREGEDEIERIQPTATIEMLEPTRILGAVSETAPAPSEYQDDEELAEEGEARSARYLKIHGATPSAPLKAETEIVEAPEVTDDESKGRIIEGLINRQPVYHYATKTLWVTKVQKYIDHKVTATLVIQNCIPNDFHFPFCHKKYSEHSVNHYYKPVHYAPVHHEPAHYEPVHHEPVHHEPVHHQPTHHAPVHHEPAHHEPVHHAPVHHEQVHHEPVHHEPAHHEPVHHEPVHHEPVHHESVHHESVHHEPAHHEPVHHEPAHHEPVHHKPVYESHYEDILHHNAHEYPQPIHAETQYIPGHEVAFTGGVGASVSGGISTNFKENNSQSVN